VFLYGTVLCYVKNDVGQDCISVFFHFMEKNLLFIVQDTYHTTGQDGNNCFFYVVSLLESSKIYILQYVIFNLVLAYYVYEKSNF
jgi:hypothetical protein